MNYTQQQMPSNISTIDLKVGEIVEFINNPDIEKQQMWLPKSRIYQICSLIFKLNINHLNIVHYLEFNQMKPTRTILYRMMVTHFQHPKLENIIEEGIFDISIGDLEFEYYDGISRIPVQIELTQQLISKVFSNYYADFPQKFEEYYQNQEQPLEFICQQTQKKYYMSDRIIYNNQDVSIHWAQDNIHLLDSVQSQYVQGYQKVLSQIALRY